MLRVERQKLQIELHVRLCWLVVLRGWLLPTEITPKATLVVLGQHEIAALGRGLAIVQLLGEHVQVDVVELVDILREGLHADHVDLRGHSWTDCRDLRYITIISRFSVIIICEVICIISCVLLDLVILLLGHYIVVVLVQACLLQELDTLFFFLGIQTCVLIIVIICQSVIIAINVVVVVVGEAWQVVVGAASYGLGSAAVFSFGTAASAAEPRQAALLGIVASFARLGVYSQVIALLATERRVVHRLGTELLTE